MGGYAFSSSLYCPRMSPSKYHAVKRHFTTRLQQLFHHVAVATEAPDKRDHGDVDFFVCRPKGTLATGTSLEDVKERVKRDLGAVEARLMDRVLFLGCPMPGVADGEDGSGCNGCNGATVLKKEFVQLDIQLCPAPSHLAYMLFATAHGDLFGFLKTGVRPFGLSLRPSGLWVRVADAELLESGGGLTNGCDGKLTNDCGDGDGKAENESLLYLSNDLDAIFRFLGLDKRKWEQPFESLQNVFEFAVLVRWFSKRDFGRERGKRIPDKPQHQTQRAKHSFEAYKAQKRNSWNVFVSYLASCNLPNDPFSSSPTPALVNGAEPCQSNDTLSSTTRLADDACGSKHGYQPNGLRDSVADEPRTRAAVLAAALAHFPGAESRYHVHLAARAAARREAAFWARVKAELPGLVAQAASGTGSVADGQAPRDKVSAQRVRRVVLALRRYTEFVRGADVRGMGECEAEADVMSVPRLRRAGRPVLDEGAFGSWTASSNLTDDDLMAFVADNWAVAYEFDRARTRPHRVARREEAAKRRAERRKDGAV